MNFTKTFKSEYHLGGKLQVQLLGNLLFVRFNMEGHSIRENLSEGGSLARVHQFLETNTSSYHAEKVIDFIKEKASKVN